MALAAFHRYLKFMVMCTTPESELTLDSVSLSVCDAMRYEHGKSNQINIRIFDVNLKRRRVCT
jgi:hypothetical protein